MKREFLSQQRTQSKSRAQLHSSGCTKQMGFGRLIKMQKWVCLGGGCRFALSLLRTDGALA